MKNVAWYGYILSLWVPSSQLHRLAAQFVQDLLPYAKPWYEVAREGDMLGKADSTAATVDLV